MRVVHKFRINMPTNVVRMDSLGHPVRVAFQAGLLQLWAEVNPSDAYKTDRVFHVYSTGEPIQEGDTYVGTATNQNEFGDEYVWHVYERTN